MHIMIVDDERILSNSIRNSLIKHDYHVSMIHSYKAYNMFDFQNHKIDLILLDKSLGEDDGFTILRELKASPELRDIPVIIISGHGDTGTKVEGLDAGSDDYLVKPFDSQELLARIRSCLRKNNKINYSSIISFHNIDFDTARRKVFLDQAEVQLSRKEKQILEFLLLRSGTLVKKEKLLLTFWGETNTNTMVDNIINVTICNLRKKLGPHFKLETIIGEGYYLHA